MPFHRKYFPVLLLSIVCLFVSCTPQIPEGDIKDFVDGLSFDRAYESVSTGKSVITSTYYVNDVEQGQIIQTTYVDTKESYYYINIEVTGSYVGTGEGNYPFENQQLLAYMNEENKPIVLKKQDDVKEEISNRQEDVDKAIHNFFYNELEAGYHRGGVYYGDYIIANCAKFYPCFFLNEMKTELSYQVNTSTRNSEGDEILTMHSFTVDSFGMIQTLSSKSIVVEKDIVIETTISCEYNFQFEKIFEL